MECRRRFGNRPARRQLRVIDATCPLVTKVHLEVIRYARDNHSIVLIGHRNHDEVIGTFGEAPDCIQLVSSVADVDVTQTTLSLDDTRAIIDRLKARFPSMTSPPTSDICYATQNRQTAIKALAEKSDLILVVGAQNSSNSNRLVDVARSVGATAYLIANAGEIRGEWLDDCFSVGVTAGASTPEVLVQRVVEHLHSLGRTHVEDFNIVDERVHFSLPVPLDRFDRRLVRPLREARANTCYADGL